MVTQALKKNPYEPTRIHRFGIYFLSVIDITMGFLTLSFIIYWAFGENWFDQAFWVPLGGFHTYQQAVIIMITIGWFVIPYLAVVGVANAKTNYLWIVFILLGVKYIMHFILFFGIIFLRHLPDLHEFNQKKIAVNFLLAVSVFPLSLELMYLAAISDYKYKLDLKAKNKRQNKPKAVSDHSRRSVITLSDSNSGEELVKIKSDPNSIKSSLKSAKS